MKELNNSPKPIQQFVGYEDARIFSGKRIAEPASSKAVKAALNRINPDHESHERG